MSKKIHLFLFNGFSDWEISYFTPEIYKSEDFELVTFSTDGNPVISMGGLQVIPTTSSTELKFEEIEMLVLPGGTAWEKGENTEIGKLTQHLIENGKKVAAICGATIYLAQSGFLNNVKHTSNDLYYLKAVAPNYRGEENYQHLRAVTDGNITTASGIAPIEFTREIFKIIGLYSDDRIEKWFQLFKNGIWSE